MTCFRCGQYPKRLREWAEYVELSARGFREGDQDSYWLCGACWHEVRRYIWGKGGGRGERVDESPDAEPGDVQAADERGAVVLPGRGPDGAEGLDEI